MKRDWWEAAAFLILIAALVISVIWGALIARRVYRLEVIIDGVFSGGNQIEPR